MKTSIPQPESVSRTPENYPKASRQASMTEILQAYRRNIPAMPAGWQTALTAGEALPVQAALTAGEALPVQAALTAGEALPVQAALTAGEALPVQAAGKRPAGAVVQRLVQVGGEGVRSTADRFGGKKESTSEFGMEKDFFSVDREHAATILSAVAGATSRVVASTGGGYACGCPAAGQCVEFH